jgi:hypothetical protein
MENSFTFKNPQRVGCYHSYKHGGDISFVVEYKHWHWMYDPMIRELKIQIPVGTTKWLEALPEKHFSLQIQTPVYWYDHRKSFKRKPVYEKQNIHWDSLTPDLVDVYFYKDGFNGYLTFKQQVSEFHGDQIMSIYQSIKGFWQEFRALLKESKTCDPVELTNMLDSINCRLITYNANTLSPTHINPAKISARYPKLQLQYENQPTVIDPADLPF